MTHLRQGTKICPANRFFSGLPLSSPGPPTGRLALMKILRNTVIRAGLEALYFSGAHYLLRPIFAGVGAIFMLHHVRPSRDAEFQPNHHLEVEPEFLRAMLAHLRTLDIDIVSMDEAHARLSRGNFARRFACFTLDDGYRDNRDFALPVMREFDAPLTVYVASDFAEGTGRLWWVALERLIAKVSAIEAPVGGAVTRFDTSTPAAKQVTFDRLHDWLRALPGEHDLQREVSALCARCSRICARSTSTSSPWTKCISGFPNVISSGASPVSPSMTVIATTAISHFP